MSEENQHESAIIPEKTTRQPALPADMIVRGLELVARIEQKLGHQSVEQALEHGGRLVRGYVAPVEFRQMPDGKLKYRELKEKGTSHAPIYLYLEVEKDGIMLADMPPGSASFPGIQENIDRFRALTPSRSREPFHIPWNSMHLFFQIVKQEGPLQTVLGPSEWPGFLGAVPASRAQARHPLSMPLPGDGIQIVMVYTGALRDGVLAPVFPFLKITLLALTEQSKDDLPATRSIYDALITAKEWAKSG